MADNSFTDDDGDLDVAAVFAAIQKGNRVAELVAARHPKADELAGSLTEVVRLLEQWVLLSSTIAFAEDGQNPDDHRGWGVRRESPARRAMDDAEILVETFVADTSPVDMMWLDTNPERNPWEWELGFLRRSHETVVDHLRGVAVLLADGSTVRSAVTAARSVLEASARTVFVLDDSIDDSERLRRVLNLRMEECKEASNSRGPDEGRAEQEKAISELIHFAERAGYVLKGAYRQADHRPPVLAPSGGQKFDVTTAQIIERVLPGAGREMWRAMSAVAHSRQTSLFFVGDLMHPHELKDWQRVQTIAWLTLPAILAASRGYALLGEFAGWDSAQWVEILDVVAVQWSIAAGLHDQEIRAVLSLDG